MANEQEWDTLSLNIMTFASVVLGAVGVIIGVYALIRQPATTEAGTGGREPVLGYSPLSVNIPRVHYADGRVLIEVRSPGEWRDIREFVQPENPHLTQIIGEALSG